MEDDINNTNGRIPKPKSSQNFLRCSVSPQSSQNRITPQQTDKRSGVLPLKRVFCRVLSDVTNTNRDTPSEPQSGVFNHPQSVHTQTESSRGKDFRIYTHYLVLNSL
ncbi:hypothetical protein HID58_007054 [Brassica napus]|uniref:Uncharacterized protein n=1 Tax=Brassica napus TaxID=3708 RepID=A0ABQ8EFQ1_BRANA|nr:hypothetical protein HID58_007054 [Brassica napus]